MKRLFQVLIATVILASSLSAWAAKFHGTDTDGSIDGSVCLGRACESVEGFFFDSLLLKDNNLRIYFLDASTQAGFPTNDWRIVINDIIAGDDFFAIEDTTGGDRVIFKIEAGAHSNSLYVDDLGRIGFGTNSPVVELHIADGDTPTIRLEQDGSSGFSPQTWDIVGNESSFSIRDATNGSSLPFRIKPGAPSNAIYIAPDGHVGIGLSDPVGKFHVNSAADFVVTDAGRVGIGTVEPSSELHIIGAVSRVNLIIENTGPGAAKMNLKNTVNNWLLNSNTTLRITSGGATAEMLLWPGTGNVEILGNLITGGPITSGGPTCGGGCDAVFAPEFKLDSIEDHASQMWANSYLPAIGPTEANKPMNLTEKTGGILNELEKAHIYIEQLHIRNLSLEQKTEGMQQQIDALRQQNQRIEELVTRLVTNQAKQVAIN